MAAPIQTQCKGDEINYDMPKSNEKSADSTCKKVYLHVGGAAQSRRWVCKILL